MTLFWTLSRATRLLFIFQLLLATASASNPLIPPLQLNLFCNQTQYAEGQPLHFTLLITNTSSQLQYPIVLPSEDSNAAHLFFFNMYDKAKNTTISRYSEACPSIDSGNTKLLWLKPQQQIRIPLTLYADSGTPRHQIHHFDRPIFAGEYLFSVRYQPKGRQYDSLFWFFDSYSKFNPDARFMPSEGIISQTCSLAVYRNDDTLVNIDGKPYYIKTDGHRFFYFSEPMQTITTDIRCIHITNLPPFASTLPRGEYFYSHFADFAEFIRRFDDGDVSEYRKFTDFCPEYLHTEVFDSLKRPVLKAFQMPDGRFYRAEYRQPGNTICKESICFTTEQKCKITTHIFDEEGRWHNSKISYSNPCFEILLEGNKPEQKNTGTADSGI